MQLEMQLPSGYKKLLNLQFSGSSPLHKLQILRDKNIITETEFDYLLEDISTIADKYKYEALTDVTLYSMAMEINEYLIKNGIITY